MQGGQRRRAMSTHRQVVKPDHRDIAGNRETLAAQGLDYTHRHGVGHCEIGRALELSAFAYLPSKLLFVERSKVLKTDINQVALRIVGDSGVGERRNETLTPKIEGHSSCRADMDDFAMPKIKTMLSRQKPAKKIVRADTVKAHQRIDTVDQQGRTTDRGNLVENRQMIDSQHDHRCGDAVLEQVGFGNLGGESVQHQKIDVDRKSASLPFLDHGPKDLVVKGIAKSGETVRN